VRAVGEQIAAAGHGVRISEVTTLESLVGNTLVREKLLAVIGGVFALLGLILAGIGMFGILNYSVSRRTREIGVRTALGAQRHEIVVLVMRDLAALVGGGLAAGLAASVGLNAAFRSLLFGVRPSDPLVMATAAVVFLTAAMDPTRALRSE